MWVPATSWRWVLCAAWGVQAWSPAAQQLLVRMALAGISNCSLARSLGPGRQQPPETRVHVKPLSMLALHACTLADVSGGGAGLLQAEGAQAAGDHGWVARGEAPLLVEGVAATAAWGSSHEMPGCMWNVSWTWVSPFCFICGSFWGHGVTQSFCRGCCLAGSSMSRSQWLRLFAGSLLRLPPVSQPTPTGHPDKAEPAAAGAEGACTKSGGAAASSCTLMFVCWKGAGTGEVLVLSGQEFHCGSRGWESLVQVRQGGQVCNTAWWQSIRIVLS